MATLDLDAQVYIVPKTDPEAGTGYDPNSGRPLGVETKGLPVSVTLRELVEFVAANLGETPAIAALDADSTAADIVAALQGE